MTREINYNLHDLLKFKIQTKSKLNLLRDINFFFSYFECKEVQDPDIILKIGKFTPSNQDCTLVDHKYWIKDNYFYCKDQEGKAKWEVEIFGFASGRATINFNGHVSGIEQILIPDYLAQNIILRPLIELKLFEKGYISIHGLGLEKDGDAYIFAARGGAHKTRIAMDLMRNGGYRLIGDDRMIVGKEYVFSYPLFFNLVRFRAENMDDEHISTISDKLKMIGYLNSKEGGKKGTEIIADKSKLKKIFLIARKEGQENLKCKTLNPEEFSKRIVNSNKMEMLSSGVSQLAFIPFMRYMLAYSYVFPESKIARYWSNLKVKLKESLENIPLYQIDLPERYNERYLEKMFSRIGGDLDE